MAAYDKALLLPPDAVGTSAQEHQEQYAEEDEEAKARGDEEGGVSRSGGGVEEGIVEWEEDEEDVESRVGFDWGEIEREVQRALKEVKKKKSKERGRRLHKDSAVCAAGALLTLLYALLNIYAGTSVCAC